MDDHSDDIRRPLSPRIEVYAGAGRKQWPDDLKAQIVAESFQPSAIVTDIARCHGCRPRQVHAWRRMARLEQLVLPASANTVSFVPLVVCERDKLPDMIWDTSAEYVSCVTPIVRTSSPSSGVVTTEHRPRAIRDDLFRLKPLPGHSNVLSEAQ